MNDDLANVYTSTGLTIPVRTNEDGVPLCPNPLCMCGGGTPMRQTGDLWVCPVVGDMESELRRLLAAAIERQLEAL